MQTLPLSLYVRDWPVVLAGGTDMAEAKARILAAACDRLVWIGAAEGHGVACETMSRPPAPSDFAGARIVVISTGDRAEDARLADAARMHGALVNVVDKPEWSDFSFPALIDRGAITVAVASGGAAPVVTRWARNLIERALPARLGDLADFVSARRQRVKETLGGINAGRRFWDAAINGGVGAAVLDGRAGVAEAAFETLLAEGAAAGSCAIVWAARPHAGELTLDGLRALGAADIVYFTGASAPLLGIARRDASQTLIADTSSLAAQVSREASAGKNVVLLLASPDAYNEAVSWKDRLDLAPVVTPDVV